MHARVAMFEGGQPDAMRRSAEESSSRASSGPPEGVPATGLLLLIDPDDGRACWVSLYETEEDMHEASSATPTWVSPRSISKESTTPRSSTPSTDGDRR